MPQVLIIQVFTVKECFHACWLVKSYTLEMSWKHVEMSWWWFSFGSNFVKKLLQKWASKTVNVIVKTNQQQLIFQWSKLCALINPRINDVKMLKKNLHLHYSPAVRGSTWDLNIMTSFLWPTREYTVENCFWFVIFMVCASFN